MSLNPPKKSDCQKAWMRSRRDSKRAFQPEYHLILSEGECTEPLYFRALQNLISKNLGSLDRGQISLITPKKHIPLQNMFLEADAYIRAHPNKPIRHIWLVYDMDDVDPNLFNSTIRKCRKLSSSTERKYHALWSNECIELWFLLHFIPLEANIPREQYSDKLGEHLGHPYQKEDPTLFESLLPYLDMAKKNAKTLRMRYRGSNYATMCPCTTIYELFDKLAPYIK